MYTINRHCKRRTIMITSEAVEAIVADFTQAIQEASVSYSESILNDEDMLSNFGLSPDELEDAQLPSKSTKTLTVFGKLKELQYIFENFKSDTRWREVSVDSHLSKQKEDLAKREDLEKHYWDASGKGRIEAHQTAIEIFSKQL